MGTKNLLQLLGEDFTAEKIDTQGLSPAKTSFINTKTKNSVVVNDKRLNGDLYRLANHIRGKTQ